MVLAASVLQMRESLFFWQEFSDQREANQSCSSGSSLWLRPLAALCSSTPIRD